jgi:hypothetical protein
MNGILCGPSSPSRRGSRGFLAIFARKFLCLDTLEALKVVAADGIAQGIERNGGGETGPTEPDAADALPVQPGPLPRDRGVRVASS